jgi:hypothetical protein
MIIQTTVQARTANATALPVSEADLAALGPAKRPRLRVNLNGHVHHARVGIMNGQRLIPLSPEARTVAGVGGRRRRRA